VDGAPERRPEELILGQRVDPVLQADEGVIAAQGVGEEAEHQREEHRAEDEDDQADDPRQQKGVGPEDLIPAQRRSDSGHGRDGRRCLLAHSILSSNVAGCALSRQPLASDR